MKTSANGKTITRDFSTLANSINSGLTVVNVVSRARSGMSRKMRFYAVNASGRLVWLNADIAELLEMRMDADGNLTLRGCGMDFASSTLMDAAAILRQLGYNCEYTSYQRI